MPKQPKIPAQDVFDQIEQQVIRQDRHVFSEMLSDALGVKPSRTAWRTFAKRNPDRYVKAVSEMAKLNGYAERTEKHIINHDPKMLAEELVARMGQDKARETLVNFGLPASLIPGQPAIDGETA